MALRIRTSKFRHVFGSQCRREQMFENVRITRNTHDSNFCSVNPKFLAVVTESSGGGSFAVLDVNRPGRVDINCPKVCGHAGAILDIKWSPFNDCIIASASDDATVKLWTIPETGLVGTLTEWTADLHGHSRRVAYLEWHPTANNVLMSVGFDYKVLLWNTEQAEPITCITCHNNTVYSICWSNDGGLIASTSKDRMIRVIDPRSAKVAMETDGHESAKSSKAVFVTDYQLFTTGFSRVSDRQYALWDVRKAGEPLLIENIDCSSGIMLPYYDPDIKVVYLAGKGDGNIRYFEISPEDANVHFLNVYQSPLPQRGLGMMPKRGIMPLRNEIARFYKLHASKNLVEPVSMIVPRKAEGFQHDVYPPTSSMIPSLTADEWTSGVNRGPILMDLEDGRILDKPRSTMSPAVLPQGGSLSKAPQITTYKAMNKTAPAASSPAVSSHTSFNPAPFPSKVIPTALRVSPEGYAPLVTAPPSSDLNSSAFNGTNRSSKELASIKNIKRLSMTLDDCMASNYSVNSSQPISSPSSTISSTSSSNQSLGQAVGWPRGFAHVPAATPSVPVHHLNGFSHEGMPAGSDHQQQPLPQQQQQQQQQQIRPSRYARFGRAAPFRSNTVGGNTCSTTEHVSAIRLVIGQPTATAHANAIHVRKVWSPPASSVAPPAPVPVALKGVTSPGTDPELKKAYFRQLEEIRNLQEQLLVKDRRIHQLEAELRTWQKMETDLGPGQSDC